MGEAVRGTIADQVGELLGECYGLVHFGGLLAHSGQQRLIVGAALRSPASLQLLHSGKVSLRRWVELPLLVPGRFTQLIEAVIADVLPLAVQQGVAE